MASVANPPPPPPYPTASTSTSTSSAVSSGNHSGSQQQHMHSIQLLHNATAGGMPHGLGLLTTVASLPPKYRSRYLNIKTKCEIPLDLSVKPPSPSPPPLAVAVAETSSEVPMATTFHSEPAAAVVAATSDEDAMSQEVAHEVVVITEKPITPPQSPAPAPAAVPIAVAVKRKLSELSESQPPAKLAKSQVDAAVEAATPTKPIKVADTAPRTSKATTATTTTTSAKSSRNKATRKLKFDEETSSPVSGTIIRPLEDITDGTVQYSNGDIDPKYNIVEITEETKAELAAIKNVIGDYVCRLCRIKFDDAFGLARHRCACIVLLEYRCPECGKQFNCPANLASHRRWHKPKKETASAKKENRNTSNQQEQQPAQQQPQQSSSKKSTSEELAFGCVECGKKFKRAAYLRKHQQTHAKKTQPAAEQDATTESEQEIVEPQPAAASATTTITGSFQTAVYKSHSSSSASSSHSYAGTHEDEGVYVAGAASSSHYDYEADYLSDCSSSTSSAGYGRLQIVEHGLTEEESIAAAALTNLRNCASVIQHTTMAH